MVLAIGRLDQLLEDVVEAHVAEVALLVGHPLLQAEVRFDYEWPGHGVLPVGVYSTLDCCCRPLQLAWPRGRPRRFAKTIVAWRVRQMTGAAPSHSIRVRSYRESVRDVSQTFCLPAGTDARAALKRAALAAVLKAEGWTLRVLNPSYG